MKNYNLRNIMLFIICLSLLPIFYKCNLDTYDCETDSRACSEQGTCTDFGYCICDDGFLGFDCSSGIFFLISFKY